MRLSVSTNYRFLFVIILINLYLHVYRIIQTGHEEGTDSWDYHALSNQVVADGNANWIIHPLSVFGIIVPAQEVGIFFIYGGINIIQDIDMSYTILWTNLIIGSFTTLIGFIFGRSLSKHPLIGISSALVFSLTNIIVNYTVWTISTRGLTLILLPVLFVFIFKTFERGLNYRYMFLTFIFALPLMSIHKVAILLLLFIPLFLLSYIFYNIQIPKISIGNMSLNNNKLIWSLSYVSFLAILFISSYFEVFIDLGYTPGGRFLDEPFFLASLNLWVKYAMLLGLPIVFIPAGFYSLLVQNNISFEMMFLKFYLIGFSFFAFDAYYAKSLFLLSLICLEILGILFIISSLRRIFSNSLAILSVLFIIIIFSIMPEYIEIRSTERVEGYKDSNERWTSADYIDYNIANDENVIYGYGIQESAIDALAGRPIWRDNEINRSADLLEYSEMNLSYFFESQSLYRLPHSGGPDNIYILDIDNPSFGIYFKAYPRSYLVLNSNYNEALYSTTLTSSMEDTPDISRLFKSTIDKRYCLYKSQNTDLYYMDAY